MGGHVNFVYDLGDEENPGDLKHFLFLESVRLSQEKQEIADERRKMELERKKLAREKDLFDKQWKIVERELRRIGTDRDNIARDKAYIEREKANLKKLQQQQKNASSTINVKSGTYFAGVCSAAGLRKRYRDLLKIYHPDSGNGDSATLLAINKEYESVKKQFGLF